MKQRYDSYKPSGIDWIGEIPSHWEIVPLRAITSNFIKGNGITKDDLDENGDIPCVRYGDLYTKYNVAFYEGLCHTNSNTIYPKVNLQYGDILLAATGENINEIGKSAVYLGHEKCLAGGDIIIIRHNQYPLFMGYAISSDYAQGQKSFGKAKLKVVHLKLGDVKSLKVALPPFAEQEAIAAWLDEKCGEIDAAIAKVDREIDLIDELKQSEISRVVARGLNPNATFRPSGIDWIGDIPEHWKICKVKHKYHILTGFTPATKVHEYYDNENGETWVTIGDLKDDIVTDSSNKVSHKYLREFNPGITPKGSLLYSFKLSVGQVAFAGENIYTNEAIASFLDNPEVDLHFLKYSSSLIINNANINIYGAPIMNQELIKNAPIVFPPLSEQREIADYLDKKCAEIDGLKVKLKKKREALAELRQSLISEVVTGKRKVV